MKWKDYEKYVLTHFKNLYPDANIQADIKVPGHISHTNRQVDILIRGAVAGVEIDIVVDCKHFNKKIDVKTIDEFLGFLRDVKANKGILITKQGYTAAAQKRAANDSGGIELRVLDYEDLKHFVGFHCIAYNGPHGAMIYCPAGWVLDTRCDNSMNVALYPLGLSRNEAIDHRSFIYGNFLDKSEELPTLEAVAAMQDSNIRCLSPSATIEYITTIHRDDERRTLFRRARISEAYRGIEYTLLLDIEDGVLFFVLLTSLAEEQVNLRALEWIGRKCLPIKVVHGARTDNTT